MLSNAIHVYLCFFHQNPKNCDNARKMVCNLSKGCGYGCQLHHVTYCLMLAYSTERTMILESKGWRYSSEGWESVFKPLSKTCRDRKGTSSKHWGRKYLAPHRICSRHFDRRKFPLCSMCDLIFHVNSPFRKLPLL